MLIARWVPLPDPEPTFVTHFHGRNLAVAADPAHHAWHWRVASPHGALLAAGVAPDRAAAERAAEDEAAAVHPPTERLLELLLT